MAYCSLCAWLKFYGFTLLFFLFLSIFPLEASRQRQSERKRQREYFPCQLNCHIHTRARAGSGSRKGLAHKPGFSLRCQGSNLWTHRHRLPRCALARNWSCSEPEPSSSTLILHGDISTHILAAKPYLSVVFLLLFFFNIMEQEVRAYPLLVLFLSQCVFFFLSVYF